MSKEPSYHELTEEELESAAGGGYDNFLKIDGIDGESQDAKKKNHIEISAFSRK